PLKAEITGIGNPPDGEKNVGPRHRSVAARTVDVDADALCVRREADTFGLEPKVDALVFENAPDRLGYVHVFTRDEAGALLDHRHLAAEAAVHLRKFKPDIAASDDNQVLR